MRQKPEASLTRRLLVMRHAKSDWDSGALGDFDRPLSNRGKRDAPRMGRWLLGSKLIPDWVISSPAVRAKDTAVKVCKELGVERSAIHWETEIYGAELGQLLQVLARCPASKRLVLLVGHNPGLEALVKYLAGEPEGLPRTGNLMPTAAIACLALPEDWTALQPAIGRLEVLTYPKALPDA